MRLIHISTLILGCPWQKKLLLDQLISWLTRFNWQICKNNHFKSYFYQRYAHTLHLLEIYPNIFLFFRKLLKYHGNEPIQSRRFFLIFYKMKHSGKTMKYSYLFKLKGLIYNFYVQHVSHLSSSMKPKQTLCLAARYSWSYNRPQPASYSCKLTLAHFSLLCMLIQPPCSLHG